MAKTNNDAPVVIAILLVGTQLGMFQLKIFRSGSALGGCEAVMPVF